MFINNNDVSSWRNTAARHAFRNVSPTIGMFKVPAFSISSNPTLELPITKNLHLFVSEDVCTKPGMHLNVSFVQPLNLPLAQNPTVFTVSLFTAFTAGGSMFMGGSELPPLLLLATVYAKNFKMAV
jgi:hypothetical protein